MIDPRFKNFYDILISIFIGILSILFIYCLYTHPRIIYLEKQ